MCLMKKVSTSKGPGPVFSVQILLTFSDTDNHKLSLPLVKSKNLHRPYIGGVPLPLNGDTAATTGCKGSSLLSALAT